MKIMYKLIATLAIIATSLAHFTNACETGVLLPHEIDCTKLYVCMNGMKIELQCVPGTSFDGALQTCVPMTGAGCARNLSEDTKLEVNRVGGQVSDLCPEGFLGIVPNPNSCDSYYMCVRGIAILLHCPQDTEYDPVAYMCVPTSESTCTVKFSGVELSRVGNQASDVCPDGLFGNVADPSSCTSFYMCVGGFPIMLYCTQNTEYDPVAKACVTISEGGCTLGSSDKTEVELSVGRVSDLCPNGAFGNVANPDSCTSFYFCAGGVPVLLQCGPNTEYNPELKACVYLSPGGCTANQQQG